MRPEDRNKLDECLNILDTTDLGLPLVWLWTWSSLKEVMGGGDWERMATEEEAWNLLCKRVESGDGFTLEYGVEQHEEDLLDWMLEEGIIDYLE